MRGTHGDRERPQSPPVERDRLRRGGRAAERADDGTDPGTDPAEDSGDRPGIAELHRHQNHMVAAAAPANGRLPEHTLLVQRRSRAGGGGAMIRVDLAQERVHNGEHLTGTMTWRAESAKVPRKLEVACRWRVEGKGRSREEVVGVLRDEQIGSRTEGSM